MKKSFIFLIIALLVSLSLVGCGSGNAGGGQTNQLIIATGGTAGTYYPLGGGIAQVIKDNTKMDASAQVTGASVENLRLISKGEVDLAFTQNDIADYAVKGTEMFKGTPVKNLKAISAMYNETIQVVTTANSGIKSVADLKGKRVSVGAGGSGVEANAKQVLEIYGLKFEDLKAEHLSFGDSSQKIQDGQLDAAFITAGAPTSAVTELSATTKLQVLSLEPDKIAALSAKYPYYVEEDIPANMYSGQTTAIKTVAVKSMLVARAELSEDQVYNITKALYEHLDNLVAINKKAESMKLDTALEGIKLDLHPGAVTYFKEKGILK
ncbi:TAXI family TRAP transporter solute-binding subunit [Tepidibacillus marianensis]|uniref:TAXI family TRAP transporter solute-binding subunit n=1 Tax=Tepidibacillus marianensis TaxID=3131995 RepID=UPI0030D3ECF0